MDAEAPRLYPHTLGLTSPPSLAEQGMWVEVTYEWSHKLSVKLSRKFTGPYFSAHTCQNSLSSRSPHKVSAMVISYCFKNLWFCLGRIEFHREELIKFLNSSNS